MEPIITGGGILIPPDSYLPAVGAACERHGVLLIVDEVICGFGRTGSWFGHDPSGVRPDIVTMAKGITSAYIPLAATVVSEEIFAAFPAAGDDLGRLRHINTFGGHPAGCAVALENIAIMEEEGLVERSAEMGARLLARLREALHRHPLVGDIRGRGLLIGIELVADRRHAPAGPPRHLGGDGERRPAARPAPRPQLRHRGRAGQRARARAAAVAHRRRRRPHRGGAHRRLRRRADAKPETETADAQGAAA